jgi:AbrB family looped-hinge helix DNA binding protein
VSSVHPSKPNRRFYGAVTVSDRGQVVIPAEARRDLGIAVGDKLLVFGDLDFGLAFGKADDLLSRLPGLAGLLGDAEPTDE